MNQTGTADANALPCNLCGRDEYRVLRRDKSRGQAAFEAHMTTNVYGAYGRIVRCLGCGLVYRHPRESVRDILSAYEKMEDADYRSEDDCRSINAHLSLRVIKKHAPGGRLLDVGCSSGFFLNSARMSFDVQGVEPSEWAAHFCRHGLRLPVFQGELERAAFPAASFDVVTLIDVIEHMTDPKGVLKEAARVIKPGGLLYIVTPDIRSFSSRVLGPYWWGLRPAHLYYFSRETLESLLRETGFTVAECRSYGRIFTYGYWLSRLKRYPAFIFKTIQAFIKLFGVADKVVYINTRDSMEICAFRRDGP